MSLYMCALNLTLENRLLSMTNECTGLCNAMHVCVCVYYIVPWCIVIV